ncbi:hypothetical protein L209DRAFT_423544 [Thermothelomyces heterothallicus CBS 203.75]
MTSTAFPFSSRCDTVLHWATTNNNQSSLSTFPRFMALVSGRPALLYTIRSTGTSHSRRHRAFWSVIHLLVPPFLSFRPSGFPSPPFLSGSQLASTSNFRSSLAQLHRLGLSKNLSHLFTPSASVITSTRYCRWSDLRNTGLSLASLARSSRCILARFGIVFFSCPGYTLPISHSSALGYRGSRSLSNPSDPKGSPSSKQQALSMGHYNRILGANGPYNEGNPEGLGFAQGSVLGFQGRVQET